MNMQISALLSGHARYRPDHLAVIFDDQRLTYSAFNKRVNRLAQALLALGIAKGDKIATILPNCLEQLEIYWAVAKIGAVVVPLSPLLREEALTTLLNASDTVLVVSNSAFISILDAIKPALLAIDAECYLLTDAANIAGYQDYHALTAAASDHEPSGISIGDDDLYNIIFSSGTTGLPKGIMHTHAIRAMYALTWAKEFRVTPESIFLHTGTLVFNGAFATMLVTFYVGGTYIVHHQFNAEQLIETIERERVTHMMLVPTQIVALLHAPTFSAKALQSLEMILSAGAPLHREHKAKLAEQLPNRFYEIYGLTEGFWTILDKLSYFDKPDSVGAPPPFFSMRIVNEERQDVPVGEVGEIIGRSPVQMTGYYKRPDLTAETIVDGWLHSGDLGYVDEEGFLYLVDRKKDMIISAGVNVYPRDIEEIIVRHPSVREAAVFGIPSNKWGETPIAAVILEPSATVTAGELCEWINLRVAARYQQVSAVVIMGEFPRSAVGKTLKHILRAPYWAQQTVSP